MCFICIYKIIYIKLVMFDPICCLNIKVEEYEQFAGLLRSEL